DWESALSSAQMSLGIFTQIGSQDNMLYTWWCIGEAHAGIGDIQKAEQAAQSALSLLESRGTKVLGPTEERGLILRLLGKISRQKGNLDLSRQHLEESANQFKERDSHLELGRTYAELAHWANASENLLEEKKFIELAEEIFEQLGAGLDLAEIQS
ncbi:MAG: hypothetical protein HC806_08375, partial [Anaerolineae bacterium]|nr:hypothetical protein [Anaerolineae bacterium]